MKVFTGDKIFHIYGKVNANDDCVDTYMENFYDSDCNHKFELCKYYENLSDYQFISFNEKLNEVILELRR
jgi:hypothetical protein